MGRLARSHFEVWNDYLSSSQNLLPLSRVRILAFSSPQFVFRTLSIDSFSKTQQRAYGLCKVCTEENQLLEAEAEEDEIKSYEQLPKRKSENRGNFPELGDLELPKYNILAVTTNPKMKFYPSETVLQRLGFTPKDY